MVFPDDSRSADDWMRALANHYDRMRRAYPAGELCIVFDIDGTILDVRHLVVHALLAYDRDHGSSLFRGLTAEDITVSENQVDALVASLDVPAVDRESVAAFLIDHLWDRESVIAASRPYEGVFGVIRWFQIQPGTHVALNTGRTEAMRRVTLDSLNTLGTSFRVSFEPDLLFMRSAEASVHQAKIAALEELRARGLRVVAAIDNEPDNLAAMAEADPFGEILFLHADTIFDSQRVHAERLVTGQTYSLPGLISERQLAGRVEFVWHGVNDEENLDRFLSAGIRWAEIDVRHDPLGRLVLRHDSFADRPWQRGESPATAGGVVATLAEAGRSVKLDIKERGRTLADAMDLVDRIGMEGDRLWFNAEIQAIGSMGFQAIRERFPAAIVSCPVDFLGPILLAAPYAAPDLLALLKDWGVSRLSLRWSWESRMLLDDLEERGWEVNVYGVPDLEAFLQAALLLPTSVTADFNFPDWRYFGRGSGQDGVIHRFDPEPESARVEEATVR
jgi:phosphoglycolate phosphatase-like HAD superfamily hydrolase